MLALIVCGVLLLLCARGVSRLLFRGAADFADPTDRFVIECWIGLLWTAWAVLVLSLFAPVQPYALVLLFAGAAAGLMRLARPSPPALMIGFGVAVAGCGTIALYDSGLYHLQVITMLREFGTLTGAASLQHRYSFSSSWFALAAALQPDFLAGRMATTATTVIFGLSTFHLASVLARISRGSGDGATWYLAIAYPIAFYRAMLETEPVSPSPNAVVALAMIVAGWLMIRDQERNARSTLLVLAAATCLKMSALPAGIIALLCRPRQVRLAGWLIVGSAPIFIANFMASGCPAFPSSFCIATAHTVAPAKALEVERETMNWARFGGFYPRSAGPLDTRWIAGWFRRSDKILMVLLAASLAIIVSRRFFNAAVAMAVGGLIFVLWSAPDFRFMYGYIAVLAGSAAAAWSPRFVWPTLLRRPVAAWAAAAMLVWLSYAGVREYLTKNVHTASLPAQLLVPPLPPPATPAANGWSGFSFSRPQGSDQCWNLPFPCTPYRLDPAVKLCDPTRGLRAGICRGEPPNR